MALSNAQNPSGAGVPARQFIISSIVLFGAMRRNTRRAATIIEIVAAIVILSIALPPLISSFADAALQSIHPSQAVVASFLATERMEEMIARRNRASDGYAALTTANYPSEAPVSGFAGYNRTVTISFVDDQLAAQPGDVGYKLVRVTVDWNGGANEILLERVFANY